MISNNSIGNNTEVQSDIISCLRFPLIIMVVYLHSTGDLTQAGIPIVQQGIYEIIQTLWGRMIVHSAVPTFFFISGFLMFYGIECFSINCYKKKIQKRISRLLVPYLLWNVIALLIWIFRNLREGLSIGDILSSYMGKGIFSCFWVFYTIGDEYLDILGNVSYLTAPINLPLWYLRDLIILSILSPVFFYFIKNTKGFSILIFASYFISGLFSNIPGLSSSAFTFYGIGAYFSIMKKDFSTVTHKYLWGIFPVYIALLLYILYNYHTKPAILLFPLFKLLGVFVIIGATASIIRYFRIKRFPIFAESTFFIYAIHYILFFSFIDTFLFDILPPNNTICHILQYILSVPIKIFLYITIYSILNHIIPKPLSILCGNNCIKISNT